MELTDLSIDLPGHYSRNGYVFGPLLSPTQTMRLVEASCGYLRARGLGPSGRACCHSRRARPNSSTAGLDDEKRRDDSGAGSLRLDGAGREGEDAAPVSFGDIVQRLPAAAAAALSPDTLFLVADVIGASRVVLVRSALLVQPAHSDTPSRPGSAQDGHPHPRPDVTAIIAVDDQFDDGGGLQLVPGSHHTDGTRHSIQDAASDTYSVPLPVGWVAILHPRLRYVRSANTSDIPRRSLLLEYAAKGAPRTGDRAAGQPIAYNPRDRWTARR